MKESNEKNNKLEEQINKMKEIEKLGISNLDNLSFGLEKYRDEFYNSYRRNYYQNCSIKNSPKKENIFELYSKKDLIEKDGYNLFGAFKDIEDFKKQTYSFQGIRKILKKYIKKYNLPEIKESKLSFDIEKKIKELFDLFYLEPKKDGEFANITKKNLTIVFYIIFLISIHEKNTMKNQKYIQQEIDFSFDK